MALKATVFRVELQVSDLDRHYYASHKLTLARHPSETDQRMMARVLLFARHAGEHLQFTRGISTDSEPDLWSRDPGGEIEQWIELGEPPRKRIARACGLAREVYVYAFGARSAPVWWQGIKDQLHSFRGLRVFYLPEAQLNELTTLTRRGMSLQVTIQDGEIWITDGDKAVQVVPELWSRS